MSLSEKHSFSVPSSSSVLMTIPSPSTVTPASPGANSINDGIEPSRMRSHKGNQPTLPQTKSCTICPAKFTRTTHLNRHLRSHTNERLHHCDTCQSQFTRSDLLTRHKRNCGDPFHANRSRRKSCQACADSKIKCDLQQPCFKCSSRGRECVFINDPQISREKKLAAAKKLQRLRLAVSKDISDKDESVLMKQFSPPLSAVSTLDSSLSVAGSPSQHNPTSLLDMMPFDSDSLSSSPTAESSSISTPVSPEHESISEQPIVCDNGLYVSNLNGQLDHLPGLRIEGDLFGHEYMPCTSEHGFSFPEIHGMNLISSNVHGEELVSTAPLAIPQDYVDGWDTSLHPSHNGQHHKAHDSTFGFTSDPLVSETCPSSSMGSSALTGSGVLASTSQFLPSEPVLTSSAGEEDQYLNLFFADFLPQMPVIHLPSWQAISRCSILIRAMKACGALFLRTEKARQFISETLEAARESLIHEFERNSREPSEQIDLLLAAVLLQTIGTFYRKLGAHQVAIEKNQRIIGMIVRHFNLIQRNNVWTLPTIDTLETLESVWRSWVNQEVGKRALLTSYVQDCFNAISFSLAPTYHPSEIDVMPSCDAALWKAPSAVEWFKLFQLSPPSNLQYTRLSGDAMQKTFNLLEQMNVLMSEEGAMTRTFSHFLSLHSLMNQVHVPEEDLHGLHIGQPPSSNGWSGMTVTAATAPLLTEAFGTDSLTGVTQTPSSLQ